jgi:glycosyltransferase involved in cell wall biosynthesis
MIVKDEVDNVKKIVTQAKPYFDKIYLTVSDKKAFHELERLPAVVEYREWTGKFDEARQHNWDLGANYDYSFWLDADDAFDFSRIPEIFAQLEEYDAVFLPYNYKYDENGNCIVRHPRERAIARRKPFYWKGWVHENLVCEEGFVKTDLDIPVIHMNSEDHDQESLERNHEILVKAVEETNDPRYLHYLGISYFTLKEFRDAIETLNAYIKVGGWDEEIYRSVTKISESYFMLGDVDTAIMEALKATAILPSYPQAYHLLCHYESQAGNHQACLEWGNVALSKPDPKGASIYDPTSKDRTKLTMSLSYFALGEYTTAYQLMAQVRTIDTSDIIDAFKYQAELETFVKILPGIYQFYDDPTVLFTNLPEETRYLPELRKVRESLTLPKEWEDDTVVFFCGKGYEEWGPHTLDKGMGGSEEAIVYLAPQLAKLGYKVTVFGEVSEPFIKDGVAWKPWNYIDKRDTFNILVIWRTPQFATQLKAKKMYIDMHDQLHANVVKYYKGVTYLFKSQYHKDQYPHITDYAIIPNGIDVSQFKTTKKKPYSVIYPSAYYRGLEQLLKVWPKVKEAVPEATLDIYYGWNSWVGLEGEDDFYKRMVQKLEDMKDQGVTEHGRVDHKTLASKYAESKVWAYPTEFPEIFCITAIKANLAGCKPVITDVAALKETGGPNADFVNTDSMYSNEYAQEKFTNKLIQALQEDHDVTEQVEWAKRFDWTNIAKFWKEEFDARS